MIVTIYNFAKNEKISDVNFFKHKCCNTLIEKRKKIQRKMKDAKTKFAHLIVQNFTMDLPINNLRNRSEFTIYNYYT